MFTAPSSCRFYRPRKHHRSRIPLIHNSLIKGFLAQSAALGGSFSIRDVLQLGYPSLEGLLHVLVPENCTANAMCKTSQKCAEGRHFQPQG